MEEAGSLDQENIKLYVGVKDFTSTMNEKAITPCVAIFGEVIETKKSQKDTGTFFLTDLSDTESRLRLHWTDRERFRKHVGERVVVIGSVVVTCYKEWNQLVLRTTKIFTLDATDVYTGSDNPIEEALSAINPESVYNKKRFPPCPRILLLCSKESQVVADFKNRLKIKAEVETFTANFASSEDIIDRINDMNTQSRENDVFCIIRGGGEKVQFQVFNSPQILKTWSNIRHFRVDGLGHHADLSLLSLISDFSAQTPTAVVDGINRLYWQSIESKKGTAAVQEAEKLRAATEQARNAGECLRIDLGRSKKIIKGLALAAAIFLILLIIKR
ncbi:MAG: hypothetical protein HQM09_23790 [Candidatus Riflebacteria bacterium]|nr:hypothetical protein [Candidatus Riflebacteria bacterium]